MSIPVVQQRIASLRIALHSRCGELVVVWSVMSMPAPPLRVGTVCTMRAEGSDESFALSAAQSVRGRRRRLDEKDVKPPFGNHR